MQINYIAVVACAILSMVMGFLWYGPIFGKKWMELSGIKMKSPEDKEKMEKSAGTLYAVQFLLSLFQVYVLAYLISCWPGASGVKLGLFLWAGFIMTTVAGSCMWNGDMPRVAWNKFLIQAIYQLIMFVLFGLILTSWP